MPKSCLIIGGGIAGTVTSLVLSKIGIKCTIYELRNVPSTIGGAVNLTPNALELLKDLNIEVSGCRCDSIEIFSYHTGSWLGELALRGPSGPAMRVVRDALVDALLNAVEKAGIKVVYGSKLVLVDENDPDQIVANFENGSSARADFIVGCDGMYSSVRMNYVEPSRKPIYTGISVAYSIVDATNIGSPMHFKEVCMNIGRYGSLLLAFVDQERKNVYLASVKETPEQGSKEGWRARGKDQEETSKEIVRRFGEAAFPCIPELIQMVNQYILFPVYKLEPGGNWSKGRVILLGDAAHGMPPQGESTGLAIEDGILFARIMEQLSEQPLQEIFDAFDKTRRSRIDNAYKEAISRFSLLKDKSWVRAKSEEWLTWIYCWLKGYTWQRSFAYDVRKEVIVV